MATPAERRAAQRRLAREIHTGTYQPTAIGRQAREATQGMTHDRKPVPRGRDATVDRITALLIAVSGNGVNRVKVQQVNYNPETGVLRSLRSLRRIERLLTVAKERNWSSAQTWDAVEEYDLVEEGTPLFWEAK
jgi:hypothetical protein